MQKAFSEILKEYQKKTGYSNAEMANVLGTSERMYAYYETGEYKGVLKKIAALQLNGWLASPQRKGEANLINLIEKLKFFLIHQLKHRFSSNSSTITKENI